MNLGVHITFYYVENRLQYLKKVIEGIESIDAEKTIFVYSNRDFKLDEHHENVKIIVHDFARKNNNKLHSIHRFYYQTLLKLGLTKLVHPFYLAWVNRKYVEKYIENFDVQMYIEDDIYFNSNTFDYWLENKDICLKNNYNLGFLRIEKDNKTNNEYSTDLFKPLDRIVDLDDTKFLLNDINPYCGFWIYEKSELKKFIKSSEWKFKFKNYRIRERSAIGWHGFKMDRYKGTLVPLEEKGNNFYQCNENSSVHHMPNNYIGNEVFCQVKFPLEIKLD